MADFNNKIVELYGLPASWKTTSAKKMAEGLGFEIIKIRNNFELFFYNLLFGLKHPVKFANGLFSVAANSFGMKMFYYKFMNCFLHVNAKHQKALKKKNALIDQGYFQNIISVFEKPVNEKHLAKYIKNFLMPDFLLIFDVSEEEMRKGLEKRGPHDRQAFGKEYFEAWLETICENHRFFLDNLNLVSTEHAVVDARKGENEIYQEIISYLNI